MSGNYREMLTVPEWKRPEYGPKGNIINASADGPAIWSGDVDPPAIGTVIKVRINALGAGTVVGYFTEYGYLGLLVDIHNPPKWHREQNKGNPRGHIFGIEFKLLEGVS